MLGGEGALCRCPESAFAYLTTKQAAIDWKDSLCPGLHVIAAAHAKKCGNTSHKATKYVAAWRAGGHVQVRSNRAAVVQAGQTRLIPFVRRRTFKFPLEI